MNDGKDVPGIMSPHPFYRVAKLSEVLPILKRHPLSPAELRDLNNAIKLIEELGQ